MAESEDHYVLGSSFPTPPLNIHVSTRTFGLVLPAPRVILELISPGISSDCAILLIVSLCQ